MTDEGTGKVASLLLRDAGWTPVWSGSDLAVRLWQRPGTGVLYGEGSAFELLSRELEEQAKYAAEEQDVLGSGGE